MEKSKLQPENYTDEELVLKIQEGNKTLTDYLLEKYKPLVRKKTNAMYLIGGEPEDLIQEGMIGLFKAIRDYRVDKESGFFHFAEQHSAVPQGSVRSGPGDLSDPGKSHRRAGHPCLLPGGPFRQGV